MNTVLRAALGALLCGAAALARADIEGAVVGVSDGDTITVLDDGPGIPPDVMPNVFERFTRGTSSRSRESGSTGLGLAIVRAIVEAHHGDVRVTSHPGQTAFVVHLPLRSAGPSSPETAANS